MCDFATHLGHFIASTDKKSIVKSAKFTLVHECITSGEEGAQEG